MKHVLTAIACCLAVTGSAQVQYNPDVDGDGCITVTDVLGILSVFNTCAEGSTLYYFHGDPGQAPWYGNQNLTNQEGASQSKTSNLKKKVNEAVDENDG